MILILVKVPTRGPNAALAPTGPRSNFLLGWGGGGENDDTQKERAVGAGGTHPRGLQGQGDISKNKFSVFFYF